MSPVSTYLGFCFSSSVSTYVTKSSSSKNLPVLSLIHLNTCSLSAWSKLSMYGSPNTKSLLNNLVYAASPSFTTESNHSLPAAWYALTYVVGAWGSSSLGSLAVGLVGLSVGAWVGSSAGALLVPGWGSVEAGSVCGSLGSSVGAWVDSGSGGVSSGGASAPSVACANFLPFDLPAPRLPSFGCCRHLPALMGSPLRCLPPGCL